jgi:putative intracellular protease/amidase
MNDSKAQALLANTKRLNTVQANSYKAIFYVGGRGPVIDLPTHRANIQLANEVRINHVR